MLPGALKTLLRIFVRILFRVELIGVENFHRAGPRAMIVANHVSLLDGVLLYLFLPEEPVFAIDTRMAGRWFVKPLLRFVDSHALDPTDAMAVKSMVRLLRENRRLAIFPEGRITQTGALMKVYEGPAMVAEKADAVLLPVGIDGAQYSPFSYLKGLVRQQWFPRIRLHFLAPVKLDIPAGASGHERRKAAVRSLQEVMLRIAYAVTFRDTTIFGAVLEAMRRHGPGRTVAEDTQRLPVTYRQLIMRAFILGEVVSGATRPGENVGVLLPNSVGVLTVILGLHSIGRVPAMLNFTAGSQGVVTAVETADIHIVYTSHKFIEVGQLQELIDALSKKARIVYLEDLRSTIPPLVKMKGAIAARFPELAYRRRCPQRDTASNAVVLFTSGSEGIPKGVVLTHANLLSNRAQTTILLGFNHRDVFFNMLPVFHSFGLLAGTLVPLLDGSKIFFYPSPLHYRIIPELCYEVGATIFFGTNTFLSTYARHAHPFDFNRLRLVVAGAEKLKDETRRLWAERFGLRIFEGYGTTEASPVVAVNTPMENRPGTVGRLVSGIECYLDPVEGIENGGKLVIRGPNIMKGYLYHGAEGQIVSPATERGVGWYDTGDVVEIDDDGFIRICGRAKRFAKIGGEMISLAAVEDLAASLWPEATHAALAIADSRKGEKIVLITDHPAAERRLLLECALARGMSELCVPRQIMVTDSVPVLGSVKIDYRKARELLPKEVS